MSIPKPAQHGLPSNIGVNLTIVVFNVALIAAVWIAALEVVRTDREETISAAIDRNDNLAIALEEYTTRTIESADAVIGYMIRDYLRNSSKFDIDHFATDYTLDNKAITDVVLADENGNIATTAHKDKAKPAKPVNVADREHFRVHLTQDTGRLFVGKPVTGRVSGKSVIPLTRRISKPDGSFGGVAIVMIEPTRFTDLLDDAKLKNLDIITLIGTDGILRARLKDGTTTAGEHVSESPVLKAYINRPNGHYFAKGQVDGIAKFFSYRTMPDYQLIAVVAAAESDVMAGFYQRQRHSLWAAGIASVFIFGFFLLLMQMLSKQRRAAASVATSQARFLATFNQAAVGITHTDLEGHLLEVNQKFCELTGYTQEELLGRKFSDITHPDDIADNIAFRNSSIDGQHNSELLEKRYIRKDGSFVWCLLSIAAVRDTAGDIDYVVAINQDISQRKEAEQALQALEQQQRHLAIMAEAERALLAEAQAVAKMGSWETRFPDLAVAWSTENHRIFETDAGSYQPTHQRFMGFIHPDDRAMVDAAFSSSLENRLPQTIQHRIVMPDGRIKIVEERWQVFVDDQGQPARAVGTCQDITDTKKAEQERAQLAAIVESSNDAVISRSLEGVIVSWNKAAERMFGWTAVQAIGRPIELIAPPDYVGKFSHIIERVERGETTEPFETIRVRKNGVRFDAQVSLSGVKDSSGQVIGIATIVRDITERKHAEQAHAQLAAIVESSSDAIISRDLNRVILSWNPAAERMFGWSAAEALGQLVRIITPPERANELAPVVQRVLNGETIGPVDALRLRKDGSRFDAQVSFSLIRDGKGEITALATIIRDITERKRAETALRAYAAQMRHLSWRLSEVEERERRDIHRELHDRVGANLAALKLDLGLINSMLSADDRNAIGDRLQRAQQLTGETVAQIRDVMGNLRPPALDDYGLLAALRNYAEPYSVRLGIPVTVDGDDILPRPAIAVETALFRIAQEALTNIAKHARASQVMITISISADRVALFVEDDGKGFDAIRPEPPHDSWGLRTMRERALAINADFRIESSPGNGTRIIVDLLRESA